MEKSNTDSNLSGSSELQQLTEALKQVSAKNKSTGECLCDMLCETSYTKSDYQEISDFVISEGKTVEEPLAYLAVICAYFRKGEPANVLPYYERWIKNPVFDERLVSYPSYWFRDIAEAYEKEYQFDKTVECLKKHFAEEFKDCRLVLDKRKTKQCGVDYYVYRNGSDTSDFYYQFYRIAEFYLRMGTTQLKEYWLSLRNSPYYQDNTYFKDMVEGGILNAEQKQAQGYIYKPATKANQQKFLAYAKERGWR